MLVRSFKMPAIMPTTILVIVAMAGSYSLSILRPVYEFVTIPSSYR